MTRTILNSAAALALCVAALAPATPAHADSAGPAIAAGIGGLALGAILGGSAAQAAPPPGYYPPPRRVYVEDPYDRPVRCWRERRPVYDEYGEVIGTRPRRVCE